MKKKLINFAIAFGFGGKFLSDIKIFKQNLNKFDIKYMNENHALPHITIIAGQIYEYNQKKIFQILKKKNIKKFKLISPGLGIFANKFPNLYVRWEINTKFLKYSYNIVKNISVLFKKNKNLLNDSFWSAKTTLAWNDLKYTHLNRIFLNHSYMFKKRSCLIDCIYLIDFSNNKEEIIYKIKLNS